jgi:photosystem II stability/assembly factor-like uncharacterized protein
MVKPLLAGLVGLLTLAGITSCVWLDPTELSCTTYGHESCPPGYHCGDPAEGSEERSCVAGAPPVGDDDIAGDDDVGPDHDDVGTDDDDSVGPDDDDSVGPDDDDSAEPEDVPPYHWEEWPNTPLGETAADRPALFSVSFPSELVGWAVGEVGTILHTEDRGETWLFQNTNPEAQNQANFQGVLRGVHFVDENTGVAVSTSATILWTNDGGQHWNAQQDFAQDLQFNAVWAAPGGVFYVAGFDGDGNGVVYRQRKAGDLSQWDWFWETLGEEDHGLNSISGWPGDSPAVVVAAGNNGTVVRLSNEPEPSARHDLPGDLFGLAVINASRAWVVGLGGLVQRTNNAGLKWDGISIDSNSDWHDVAFVDDRYGWIAGNGGQIFRTTDRGQNWSPDPMPQGVNNGDLHIYDIEFNTRDRGWAVGNRGLILRAVPDDSPGDDDDDTCTNDDIDADGITDCDGDCLDTDGSVYPGAPEACDTIDNDCDGFVDEDFDLDGDLYFTEADNGCVGFYATTDCDDLDGNNFPGNAEVCDGEDNNCDTVADEGAGSLWFLDGDEDSYGNPAVTLVACDQPIGYVSDNTDCDDGDGNNFPGNAEVCDAEDNNCDNVADEGAGILWFLDEDGDFYGNPAVTLVACSQPIGYVSDNTDCNDDPNNWGWLFYPGATETCSGQDNNCNLVADDGCTSSNDQDGDGFDNPGAGGNDCNDNDPSIHPGVWDTPGDSIDSDCDGNNDTTGASSAVAFTSECWNGPSNGYPFVVGSGGDFDGNGVADLVFGNPYWASGCSVTSGIPGRTYLWRSAAPLTGALPWDVLPAVGATASLGTSGAYLDGPGSPAGSFHSGYTVALGGDINSDGFSDLLIGVPVHPVNGGLEGGAVYLVLGGDQGNPGGQNTQALWPGGNGSSDLNLPNADFTFFGSAPHDMTGAAVAWAGDINDDTYDEILIGAPGWNSGDGKVYLLDGATIANSLTSPANSLSCYDQAGLPAPNCRNLGPTGSGSPPAAGEYNFNGQAGEGLGEVLAGGLDLSGDGKPDLAMGSVFANSGWGAVYLFFSDAMSPSTSAPTTPPNHWDMFNSTQGETLSTTDRDFELIGSSQGAKFPSSIAMVPDVIADGPGTSLQDGTNSAELLIGQPGGSQGKAFVVLGSTIMNLATGQPPPHTMVVSQSTNNILTFKGDSNFPDSFGVALAASDIDGDFLGDILICAPDSNGGGRGYLFKDNSLFMAGLVANRSSADVVFRGLAAGDHFCSSVAFPGNVDGVGDEDLLIGDDGWGTPVGHGGAFLFKSPLPP